MSRLIRQHYPGTDPAALTFDNFLEALEDLAEQMRRKREANMTPDERAHEAFKAAVRARNAAQGIPMPDEDEAAEAEATPDGLLQALQQTSKPAGGVYAG